VRAREVHKRTVRSNDTDEGNVDGDKCSYVILHTKEAIDELHETFRKRSFYITPEGNLTYSASNTVIDIVAKTLSW